MSLYRRGGKRVLDILVALLATPFALPVVAIAGLLIKLDSPGPVFHRAVRVGRGGRKFAFLKLRSMQEDAEELRGLLLHLNQAQGPAFKLHNDPRVTRVGKVLRKTSLDELPQLWHVLTGDMSLVGPRPIRPAFFEQLCEQIPQYWQRLVVPPGMTGFAQLRMTREMTWEEKLAHDFEYIADRSPGLYMAVLAQTGALVTARLLGRDP